MNPLFEVKVADVANCPRRQRLDKAHAAVRAQAGVVRTPRDIAHGSMQQTDAAHYRFTNSEKAVREDAAYAVLGLYDVGPVLGLAKNDARALARYGLHVAVNGAGYAAAKEYALLAVAADEDYVPACLLLGACLARENREREALVWYERAKQRAPKDVRAYVDCGELKLGLGDYLGAAADFKTALELDPEGKLAATRRAMSLVARTVMALS